MWMAACATINGAIGIYALASGDYWWGAASVLVAAAGGAFAWSDLSG